MTIDGANDGKRGRKGFENVFRWNYMEEFILFAARAHDDDLLHKVSRSLCARILIDVN